MYNLLSLLKRSSFPETTAGRHLLHTEIVYQACRYCGGEEGNVYIDQTDNCPYSGCNDRRPVDTGVISFIIIQIIKLLSLDLPPVHNIVIRDQHRKYRSEEGRIDLDEQSSPAAELSFVRIHGHVHTARTPTRITAVLCFILNASINA